MAGTSDDEKIANFHKIREEMAEQGYRETEATISVAKANIGAILYALPWIILGLAAYIALWSQFVIDFDFLIVLLFVACLAIHELLHGLGWGLFCVKGFSSIRFGVIWKMLTPYCHCTEPLSFGPYLFGGMLPFIVLGFIPLVISLVTGNSVLLFLSLVNIVGAGGDLTIMGMLMKHCDALILDHPTDCGFYAYTKTP